MRKSRESLLKYVYDPALVDFFYLKLTAQELFRKLHGLKITLSNDKDIVPFNAQLREYIGATDNEGQLWIAKKLGEAEIRETLICELAYLLDFELDTLSAPTLLCQIKGQCYRVTKIIKTAMQISSYNYTAEPLRRTLANDLINRWLMYDEDRNPNNYMVLHNSLGQLLVVAIDYNHSDLESAEIKIKGNERQFGWYRTEKTRFLTLLKPANFEGYALDDFTERLDCMMGLDLKAFRELGKELISSRVESPPLDMDTIIDNIRQRREYINSYFHKIFKTSEEKKKTDTGTDYSGLGSSFVSIYKDKI